MTYCYRVIANADGCGSSEPSTTTAASSTTTSLVPEVSGAGASLRFWVMEGKGIPPGTDVAGVTLAFQYLGPQYLYHLYSAASQTAIEAGNYATKLCDLEHNLAGTWLSNGVWWFPDSAALPEWDDGFGGRMMIVAELAGTEGTYGHRHDGAREQEDLDRNAPDRATITSISDVTSCAQSGIQIAYTAGSGASSHDLYKDGSLAAAAYASGAVFNPGDAALHNYSIRAINTGCSSFSDPLEARDAMSDTAPEITSQPQSTAICPGTSTTLAVTASGTNLHYQWYQGTAPDTASPVGTDSSSFPTGNLSATTSYWVRVSGACSPMADSETATVTTICPPARLVISQVYARTNSAPSTYDSDFVELFNAGATGQDVHGWSIQVSANGSNWTVVSLSDTAKVIPPGGFFLVQLKSYPNGVLLLQPPDASDTNLDIDRPAGIAAIVASTSRLTSCTALSIVDFVEWGPSTTCAEGSPEGSPAVAPTTNQISMARGDSPSPCYDSGDNFADFVLGSPNPRNSASPTSSTCSP
jgi:hypothetical protein